MPFKVASLILINQITWPKESIRDLLRDLCLLLTLMLLLIIIYCCCCCCCHVCAPSAVIMIASHSADGRREWSDPSIMIIAHNTPVITNGTRCQLRSSASEHKHNINSQLLVVKVINVVLAIAVISLINFVATP